MIVVRRIGADESARLRSVRLRALADAPSAFGSTYERELALGADEWEDRTRRSATGEQRSTFLALDDDSRDGAIVGIVAGLRGPPFTRSTEIVELISMWVDPAHRRIGLGRRLVGAVVEWAGRTGAREVELSVALGNEPAAELYRSLGFDDLGDVAPLASDPTRIGRKMALTLRPGSRAVSGDGR